MIDAKTCGSCGSLNAEDAAFCARCGEALSDLEAAPGGYLPGDLIGSGAYKIVRTLGEGGMGAVYEAVDTSLGRSVALKFLHSELLKHPTAAARFEREGRALASIDHPNVVRIHTRFEHEGATVLALELVTGGDLTAKLKEGLNPKASLKLMTGILRGLVALHEKGLVHRDLKPDNILISPSDGAPKITDLGIAHETDQERGMTQMGARLGTPEYMSPEQIRGVGVDARSDLYASGIILYEMLVGEVPFTGATDFDIWQAHSTRDIPTERLQGRTSPAVIAWVNQALSKSAEDRWPSSSAALEALMAIDDTNEPTREFPTSARASIQPKSPERPEAPGEVAQSAAQAPERAAPLEARKLSLSRIVMGILLASAVIAAGVFGYPAVSTQGEREKPIAKLNEKAPARICKSMTNAQLKGIQGDWKLVTLVTGSTKKKNKPINGFYDLRLDPDQSNCRVQVELTKRGYGRRELKKPQPQSAVGTAMERNLSLGRWELAGWELETNLVSQAKKRPTETGIRMIFRPGRDGGLEGLWTYTGDAFRTNGFHGILVARRAHTWPKLWTNEMGLVSVFIQRLKEHCRVRSTKTSGPAWSCSK